MFIKFVELSPFSTCVVRKFRNKNRFFFQNSKKIGVFEISVPSERKFNDSEKNVL